MAKTRRNKNKRGGTKYEAKIDAIDDTGERPIFTHVKANNFEMVKILIDNGANLDYADNTQNTIMHYAAKIEDDDVKILKYIIKNSNARDLESAVKGINDRNQTPLHLSVLAENAEAAKLLVENRADIYAVDKEGHSPVSIAEHSDNETMWSKILVNNTRVGGKKSRKARPRPRSRPRSRSRPRPRSGGKKNKKAGKTRKH